MHRHTTWCGPHTADGLWIVPAWDRELPAAEDPGALSVVGRHSR
jgi:hypothetical protein